MGTLKETVIQPNGVVTQPNQEGMLPPGTLKTGTNVMMRRQGVLEPRPGFEQWEDPFGTFPNPVPVWMRTVSDTQVMAVQKRFGTSSVGFFLFDGSLTPITLSYDFSVTIEPGKVQESRVRDRVVIASGAPGVFDPAETPGAGPAIPVRHAGLPPPLHIQGNTSVTPPNSNPWFISGNFVAYKALIKRKFDDGYIVTGQVSAAFAVEALNTCVPRLTIRFYLRSPQIVVAGDLIELYRVIQQSDIDLLGDRYQLSMVHEVTTAEAIAGSAVFFDPCPEENLGADLYVNDSEEGASKNNFMPPPSIDVITFKGATFYSSTQEWHRFNTAIAGEVGDLSAGLPNPDLLHGIGRRPIVGSVALGSAQITGVADTTGLKAGQEIDNDGGVFPAGTTIISVNSGAGIVGTSAVSLLLDASYSGISYDVILVDGETFRIDNLAQLVLDVNSSAAAGTIDTMLIPDRLFNPNTGTYLGAQLQFLNPISGTGPFTLAATNGVNYFPPLPEPSAGTISSDATPRTNRVHYSKIDQPEAVPPDNFLLVGKGVLLRMFATQDSLFGCATDGIHRIDGDGDDWSVKPYDPDTVLLAPDAIDSMDNTIYAITTAGFVSFTDTGGIRKISSPLIGNDIRDLEKQFQTLDEPTPFTWNIQVACDKYRNEVWLNYNDLDDTAPDFQVTYIWNDETNTFFTQDDQEPTSITYVPFLQSILTADANTISIYDTSGVLFMAPEVVFNPIFGEDLGILKQYIDVTLFLEDLTENATVTPQFDNVNYSSSYTLVAAAGPFDHVIVPLQNSVHSKECNFGFTLGPATADDCNFRLKGLSYRYRLASETLRA